MFSRVVPLIGLFPSVGKRTVQVCVHVKVTSPFPPPPSCKVPLPILFLPLSKETSVLAKRFLVFY